MALRTCFGWLLVCLAPHVNAQLELFGDAIGLHAMETNRILAYDDIAIQWKMNGQLQVHLNEGINNLFENNPALAETNFTDVIKADSTIWQAYYYRGISRKQSRKLKDAEADLLHVIGTRNLLYECYIELGKISQLEDNVKDAEKFYDKGIKADPRKPLGYFLRANIQLAQNQQKDAAKNFNLCLLQDSVFHDARIKIGIIEIIKKKQFEAGLPYFNHVLRNDSLQRYALLFRSMVNFSTDQERSLSDLNHVVRLSPDNVLILYLRGLLLTEMGDYRRSFTDFHKVIERVYESDNNFVGKQTLVDKKIDIQNAGAYTVSRVYGLPEEDAVKIKKAYCLMLIGKYSESINSINETSFSGTEPLCLFLKGVASEHIGKHDAAYNFYNQALELDNDILDAHKKRGIYRQEMKQWASSIADFTEVLRINPETYVVYKIRGVSYYHLKNFPKAVSDFTQYLERDSTNKEIIASRGMAYMGDGQDLKASLDFAESGELHMLDYKKIAKSLELLLQNGDTAVALTYLNPLTKSVPVFTEGYALKFKILVSRQDWKSISNEIDNAIGNRRPDVNHRDQSYLLTIKAITSGKGNRYEEAIIKLNEAIEYDKLNALAFLERGKILLATGKNNKAINDLKRALSLGEGEAKEILSGLDGNR